ncbi:hypothetical protein AC249_AIPGENE22499 [Exaiptasia diaphana]|nr:hypothetical protein AC249_AIPGENE22499 [Exaiptasia diaphana]
MDDLNMSHILRDEVEKIGHGVQLVAQDNVDSKTLVCYLDDQRDFHYGFCYKNGSNLRVVVWDREDNAMKRQTPPKGSHIIAFTSEMTEKRLSKDTFIDQDFNFEWFGVDNQNLVKEELESLIKQEKLKELMDKLRGLNIQEMDEVTATVDKMKN